MKNIETGKTNVYFNSRPSARGDILAPNLRNLQLEFQFTPLREGRQADALTIEVTEIISIHAPPRGATSLIYTAVASLEFQFTPLREGRRVVAMRKEYYQGISIHAPPRGATAPSAASAPLPPDFNSRPSARGDAKQVYLKNGFAAFQFTPLREGRLRYCPQGFVNHCISIHAPPRGATLWRDSRRSGWRFQFTPLREGRRNTLSAYQTS